MKKNKKAVLIITIIVLISAVIGMIYMINDTEKEDVFEASFVYNTDFKIKSYNFYTPDYQADIISDPDYLKQVPYIYYTKNGVTYCITDEDYEKYGEIISFFGKYFDLLKSGDTEGFNSLHSERYFKFNRLCTQIAPQRLYNINIEYMFEKDVTDPEYGEVTKYVFKTSYMIMKNDGTFRSDIGSDSSRALYLEIVYNNGDIFVDACGNAFKYPGE